MLNRLRNLSARQQIVFGAMGQILLFIIAFSYAMFQGGFVSWFVFYSYLPVFLNAMLVLFYPLRDIKMNRVIHKGELFGGESLTLTIEISRKLAFPLFYLVVQDQLPKRLLQKEPHRKKEKTKGLFSLGFKRRVSFTYQLSDMPRGDYRFTEIELRTGDFFGFIQKKRTVSLDNSVVVYPRVQTLDEWKPVELAFGGSHRSKKQFEQDLTSFSSIRDYLPGDRLSWLDWKATARANRLVTKQFDYPMNRDMIVVLDCFGVAQAENRGNFERSVSLAASLLDRITRFGASVGFIAIGNQSAFFEMSNQARAKWQILNYLVGVEPNGEGTSSFTLSKYLQRLPHHASIVYVTTQSNEKDSQLLYDIASRGMPVELFFVNDALLESQRKALLARLNTQSIITHQIKDNQFNQDLKVGGSRATS
ncbi:DUF58 domain-containing protein [Pullulanibacillus sp. KACC 23026]|uniref:DUF58 domain-containing protein n=1 Tax=Pullulanibacillus sp. KACC 23026 TaxID=3028315 RepID=UPI0023AEB0A1|nr:DUF58 domain-containing protein [Pullulanibacillus sp. KACC 23026]WEG12408.1 DUF58 domain-containing protein [Pullulanibacillus sp. KACC 23026]